MARPLRFVYPGACQHLMASGDGGKMIFIEKEDYLAFLGGLGRVRGSHGSSVVVNPAWVTGGFSHKDHIGHKGLKHRYVFVFYVIYVAKKSFLAKSVVKSKRVFKVTDK